VSTVIGRHRRKRETTTADYDAMLIRMIRSYGKRVGRDPEAALGDLRSIESELTDAVNLGLHTAIESGQSATELAGILGVSRQAIYKRAGLGGQVARQRAKDRRRRVRSPLASPGPGDHFGRVEPREIGISRGDVGMAQLAGD
jgi:hypothetical protein